MELENNVIYVIMDIKSNRLIQMWNVKKMLLL